MRSLSPEEAALWARVTATIRPLSRQLPDEPAAKPPPQPAPVRRVPAGPATPRSLPEPKRPVIGTTLDSSWERRLRSGQLQPDRTVDLHGHGLDGAWRAIDQALDRAIAAKERVVLLITGHERPGDPPVVRGKIRAAVHDWLAASRHAASIASVRGAHRRHGGGGSLYVILRRR